MSATASTSVLSTFSPSRDITLKQVKAFLSAVDCRSFSDAARELRMSQSAMSRCIKDMESALEQTLFLRCCDGVALSPAGEVFLPKAYRLQATYEKVLAVVAERRSIHKGQFSLLCSADVLTMVLGSVVHQLRTVFSQAAISIKDAVGDDVVAALMQDTSSIGVCSVVDHHPGLRHTDVLEAQLGLLTSPQVQVPYQIDDLSALANVPIVRFDENSLTTRLLRKHSINFHAYSYSPISVCSMQAATELVRSGLGVAVTSGVTASTIWADGLRFIPLPGLLPVARVSIASPRQIGFCADHERVRELLRDCIHAAPWSDSVRRIGAVNPAHEAAAHLATVH